MLPSLAPSRLVRALPLLLAPAFLAPATAGARSTQQSIFQDDRVLLAPDTRERGLDELQALGVDTIRVLAIWRRLAPRPGANARPSFEAADPAAYGDRFEPYDALVRGAAARGMSILLTPTGPSPDWASECGGRSATRARCRPEVDEFELFVRALGTRYGGNWPAPPPGAGDPGGGPPPLPLPFPMPPGSDDSQPPPAPLPRVSTWSIWNEPNLSSWLYPQRARSGGRTIGFAARRYRELFLAGTRALEATGHGGDRILLGETAPIGSSRTTPPVAFLREVLCLDGRGRPLRGGAARVRGCRRPPRLPAAGVAHHPYTFSASAAPTFRGRPGDVTISSLRRLTRVLDGAARHGRIARRIPVFLTEFGFQTNPPDRYTRTTPARQAEFLNQSELIAYRNPRVASVAQYQLVDEPDPANFNTGLRFTNWKRKPSLRAYAIPLFVERSGPSHVRVFGGVRAAEGGAAERVEVQRSSSRRRGFQTVATLSANRQGYVLSRLRRRGGYWRLAWRPAGGGATRYSRVAPVR